MAEDGDLRTLQVERPEVMSRERILLEDADAWPSKNMGFYPPNHPFVHRGFHYFHHPFWGTTIFGNTQIGFFEKKFDELHPRDEDHEMHHMMS